ncbi:hypothetical protein MRX96_033800 [Rhipicephalus microplus]
MSTLAQVVVAAHQSGGTIVSFWWALINFLQDDESSVRDGAVKAVTKLITLLSNTNFSLKISQQIYSSILCCVGDFVYVCLKAVDILLPAI